MKPTSESSPFQQDNNNNIPPRSRFIVTGTKAEKEKNKKNNFNEIKRNEKKRQEKKMERSSFISQGCSCSECEIVLFISFRLLSFIFVGAQNDDDSRQVKFNVYCCQVFRERYFCH